MKKHLLTISIMLLYVVTLIAKPVLDIKLLNSFTIDTLEINLNSSSFCVADTLLLLIDTADSTRTKSYAFDFKGNKVDTFKTPPDSSYGQFFFVNYLYGSNRVAVCGLKSCNIDYYSLEGQPLGSKEILTDWSLYLNALEWKNTPYYIVFNLREAEYGDMVTSSMTWSREKNDGEMQLLRKECIVKDWLKNPKSPFQYKLLMDNNKDRFMTMVDERETEFVVTNPDSSGWNIARIKRKKGDFLSRVITGENFFLLYTWNSDLQYTQTSGVYDLSGKKILNWSSLKQYETKGKDIIDIAGDKMFTYDYIEKLVRIYQIRFTSNK